MAVVQPPPLGILCLQALLLVLLVAFPMGAWEGCKSMLKIGERAPMHARSTQAPQVSRSNISGFGMPAGGNENRPSAAQHKAVRRGDGRDGPLHLAGPAQDTAGWPRHGQARPPISHARWSASGVPLLISRRQRQKSKVCGSRCPVPGETPENRNLIFFIPKISRPSQT